MKIGVLKEIKTLEGRVAMTPDGVKKILASNPGSHEIFIQTKAGEMSGFPDEEFIKAGGVIISTAKEVFEKAKLIVHVKEPLPEEFQYIRSDHILFTYLHLAPAPELTKKLLEIGCIGFAYETLETTDHNLPLLAPMSKVAGQMSFVYALYTQQKKTGGRGIFLGQIDGKSSSQILIIGGGYVGTNAAEPFLGIGANVTILERNPDRMEELKKLYPKATILPDTALKNELSKADVVIGAVLVAGAKAPKLIKKSDLKKMKKGASIIDISIDQGGITEVSRPTSIKDPSYIVDDIVINCIPNIPGTVPRTSTELLIKATLPYVIKLANEGLDVLKDYSFQKALNVYNGKCTYKPVSDAVGVPFTRIDEII
ncbi:MAG: alanine dehydrogenase [archaeon]|nr:alanine dehydrogenase [archaeon]